MCGKHFKLAWEASGVGRSSLFDDMTDILPKHEFHQIFMENHQFLHYLMIFHINATFVAPVLLQTSHLCEKHYGEGGVAGMPQWY